MCVYIYKFCFLLAQTIFFLVFIHQFLFIHLFIYSFINNETFIEPGAVYGNEGSIHIKISHTVPALEE